MGVFKLLQIIIFFIVNGVVFYFGYKKFSQIYKNINLGKDKKIEGDSSQRIKNVLLIALGQKKMFKDLLPAIMHLFVYLAFLITQIELIEIFLDGFTGGHRLIYHAIEDIAFFKALYVLVVNSIEILSVFALFATFVFLYRRNLLKVPRL
ncbi:MAG: Fe-S oxidoreductase, partial [Bacteroidetes bacterium]|nr:Fe-S oxidoreductase [Bacteroidota bacterium]